MPPRTAVEALNAGFARWKRVLFSRPRVGLLLKLSFVAAFAEFSGGGGFNGNFGNGGKLDKLHALPPAWRAALFSIFVAVAAVGFVVGLVLFYISCRLKFVEFNIAAAEDTRVSPAWNHFGRQTWRLFWTTLLIDFVALVALAATALPLVIGILHGFGFGHAPSLRQILALLLVVVPIAVAWAFAVQFVLMIVRDLMLPVWAMEDGSVGYSLQVARRIIEQDIGSFAGYTLVKIALHIGAGIASVLAFFASALVSAIPFVLVGLAIYLPLHNSDAAKLVMVLLFAVEAVLAFAWFFILACICFGAAALIYQCYAVEWVAARYPPLGNLMYPPPPPAPVIPPPEPPSPAGGEDWTTVLG